MMTKNDWALLAISFGEPMGVNIQQVQKSLFVFGKEMPGVCEDYFHYYAGHYGPTSTDVFVATDKLSELELIRVSTHKQKGWIYTPAVSALGKIERLADQHPKASKYLEEIIHWARKLGFMELVNAVNKRYPEFAVNSVFRTPDASCDSNPSQ